MATYGTTKKYEEFCNYIAKVFFTPEKRGENVSMIVNKRFIKSACESLGITENKLISDCLCQFDYAYRINREGDILTLGIVCIQLYAASKRANDYIATSRNYRIQLARLFDMDESDVSRLFDEYQDNVWSSFYKWCKKEGFRVYECKPFWGAGRYVQYPLKMSERTFTEEELGYIAYDFVCYKLYPHENISLNEFKRILPNLYRLSFNSSHASDIIWKYQDDAYEQLYSFYRTWDGSYERFGNKGTAKESELILLKEDNWELAVYNSSSMKKKNSFQLSDSNISQYINQIPFKHDSTILFRKHPDYDGYWEETRFLEKEEEGIAVVFGPTYRYKEILHVFPACKIVRIKYSLLLRDLFGSDEIPYRFEGGLRIGIKSLYLKNGAPLLYVKGKRRFWIDDQPYENETEDWCKWTFSTAPVGKHVIKIPGFPQLSFVIVDEPFMAHSYPQNALRWNVDKKQKSWEQNFENDNPIVGLDFSSISQKISVPNLPVLNRWVTAIAYKNKSVEENNLVIKLISV